MGQGVSADAERMELQDLLCLGHSPQAKHSAPLPEVNPGHHIKAWRFEASGSGRKPLDSPVALCDDRGVFGAELSKTASYLILHVWQAGAGPAGGPAGSYEGTAASLLEDLATQAGSKFTPRGLSVDVSSRSETVATGTTGTPPMRYAVFVWHGLSVDPLVKAHVFAKSFELDRLLRNGLLGQRGFIESLARAMPLTSRDKAAGVEEHDSDEDVYVIAAEAVRQSHNRLLTSLLEGVPGRASQPGGERAGGGACLQQRFPRLGLSVRRSLGLASPRAGGGCRDADQWASAPSSESSSSAAPTQGSGQGSALTLGPPEVAAGAPRKGPVVPRLALDQLKAAPSEGGRGSGPPSGPGAGAGPENSTDTAPAVASMDVDDAAQGDGSGRKRFRGHDVAPLPLSARGAPAATVPLGAASTVPKTARTDLNLPQFPPLASGRCSPEATAPAKGLMPALNLSMLGSQPRQPAAPGGAGAAAAAVGGGTCRTDAPAMLNLEEINMSEEEVVSAYDPENEENNYHLPHHVYKSLQLKHYRQVCSEVVPKEVFISSYQVASDLECLRKHRITHIVNTAADICDNCFPDQFHYTTYYLKDINNEEISLLFYRTLEWIQAAVLAGGRVLVHCREGVSRSATMIIAYLMWRYGLTFDAAHERLRKVRPICNPNTGFTCQLLLLGKKLGVGNSSHLAALPSDRPTLSRVTPHHVKEPFLLLMPVEWSATLPIFDPRFGWVIQRGLQLVLWLGSQVPDPEAVRAAVLQHAQRLEAFERNQYTVAIEHEGRETPLLWQALGLPGSGPADRSSLAAVRPAFDADYEILRACAAAARGGSAGAPASGPAQQSRAQQTPRVAIPLGPFESPRGSAAATPAAASAA